jgi:nitric oxide reductase NorE protein
MSTTTMATSKRLPGEQGVWIFVAADMMIFGVLFASFVIERSKKVDLYNLSQLALDFNIGGINTLILLTSSWFVVLAVHAAKVDKLKQLPWFLGFAILTGMAFLGLKIFEYTTKIQAGISMLTNGFYMFYFVMTGLHMLHVIGGTVVLIVLWNKARAGDYHSRNFTGLESGATFWHMVDLLWIVLFPLLYLMR